MPREVDCPDCDGSKNPCKTNHTYGIPADAICGKCGYTNEDHNLCETCQNTGKIMVYTEEEFQEAIGEYANTKLYQEGYRSGVKAEKEVCALICDEYAKCSMSTSEERRIEDIAEELRTREQEK